MLCVIPGCELNTTYGLCKKHYFEYCKDGVPAWVVALETIEQGNRRRDSRCVTLSLNEEYEVYPAGLAILKTRDNCDPDTGLPSAPYDTDEENEEYARSTRTPGVGSRKIAEAVVERIRQDRCLQTGTKYDLTRERSRTIMSWGCLVCGTHKHNALILAHDVPVCRGGDTTFENTFCLCNKHNRQMFTQTLEEWRPDLIPGLNALRESALADELEDSD